MFKGCFCYLLASESLRVHYLLVPDSDGQKSGNSCIGKHVMNIIRENKPPFANKRHVLIYWILEKNHFVSVA